MDLTGGGTFINDSLTPLKTIDYVVSLQPQQNLSVVILGGDVVMGIYDPSGQRLSDSGGPQFSFRVPTAGEYRIRMQTNDRMNDVTNYILRVEVENLAP